MKGKVGTFFGKKKENTLTHVDQSAVRTTAVDTKV